MAAVAREQYNDIITALMYDSSESDSSSSDEDDHDLVLLDCLFPSANQSGPLLNIDDLSNWQCQKMFRFHKDHMHRICCALNLPEYYTCNQKTKASGMEALMILLRRLVYPNRWCDLVSIFGRSEPQLSLIFNKILDDIYDRFGYLLDSLDLIWFDPELFSKAIHNKGAPLTQCWGFIDGTIRPVARPVRNQEIMFSGHKRTHCIKFQSVHAPNGLIVNMFGPVEGRRHDAFILGVSNLIDKLSRIFQSYIIYGDPAYGVTDTILAPFRGASLTADEQEFNKRMSKLRVSVEWGFGKIAQYFAFLDFKKNQKILLQPIGKYYLVGTLLINCHTCLYGSLTTSYFGVQPPSLETYLSNH